MPRMEGREAWHAAEKSSGANSNIFVELWKQRIYREREWNKGPFEGGPALLPFAARREREEWDQLHGITTRSAQTAAALAAGAAREKVSVLRGPTLLCTLATPPASRPQVPYQTTETSYSLFRDSEWNRADCKVRNAHVQRLRQLRDEVRSERHQCKKLELRASSRGLAIPRTASLPAIQGGGKHGRRKFDWFEHAAPSPRQLAQAKVANATFRAMGSGVETADAPLKPNASANKWQVL